MNTTALPALPKRRVEMPSLARPTTSRRQIAAGPGKAATSDEKQRPARFEAGSRVPTKCPRAGVPPKLCLAWTPCARGATRNLASDSTLASLQREARGEAPGPVIEPPFAIGVHTHLTGNRLPGDAVVLDQAGDLHSCL